MEFKRLCNMIMADFIKEWDEGRQDIITALNMQKKAIIGYEREVSYFKDRIRESIKKYRASGCAFPSYYATLPDAVYHENWGLAGIAEWFSECHRGSSSAKIIGSRIYFLEDGRMKLKEQSIEKARREQLIRAFLLLTPEERLDKDFHELYMLDGTRVTIFGGSMAKRDQDMIIFRRYTVPEYTFEEQASRGTIPSDAADFFRAMVSVGFNVAFTGAVRTAKTTFLSTWQSYEDQELEGVMVETDPEIPLHELMVKAPIMQIIADNEKLKNISKNLLRSDADYFIMAEARDGIALDTVVKLASKGTRRMKITFHSRDPREFCSDVAAEIVKSFGGSIDSTASKVAKSFDYIFHFIQLPDKSKKRLSGIYELGYDYETNKISIVQICRYDRTEGRWHWTHHIGADKRVIGESENPEAFTIFDSRLLRLAEPPCDEKKARLTVKWTGPCADAREEAGMYCHNEDLGTISEGSGGQYGINRQ